MCVAALAPTSMLPSPPLVPSPCTRPRPRSRPTRARALACACPRRLPNSARSLVSLPCALAALVAGVLSDRLFQGRRGPVVCLSCALLAPSLACLSWLSSPTLLQLNYLWLGVCAFPVHVLLGLFSREVVPPSVSSSAGGFVKMIAQIGGASAGSPLGALQVRWGWDGVLTALACVSLVSACASMPLWKTTAAIRIAGRNGTVQDFDAMQRKASKPKLN